MFSFFLFKTRVYRPKSKWDPLEICPPFKGLPEPPIAGHNSVELNRFGIAGGDSERQAPPHQSLSGRPILPPIPPHLNPLTAGSSDLDVGHVAGAAHVEHQHQQPVRVSGELELDAAALPAGDPAVADGDDAGPVAGDSGEHVLGEIEVALRRIAPDVVGFRVVWGAEIGGRDFYAAGAWNARLRRVHAPYFEARAARRAVVE